MNTYSQMLRCLPFAQQLGFGNQFLESIEFGEDSVDKIREHLRVTHFELSNIYYIEQKMTNPYARWNVDRNIDQIIGKTFREKIQTITKTHPLIILQYPHSSHVNKHQNIANINIYTKLKEY